MFLKNRNISSKIKRSKVTEYAALMQGEHSAILSTFIKLSFVIKIFVLSIFEWLLKTGFTVYDKCQNFMFWPKWFEVGMWG